MKSDNNNILLFTKKSMILTLVKEKDYFIKKHTIISSNEFLHECKSFASRSKFVIEFKHGYNICKITSIIKSLLELLLNNSKTITL